MAVANNLRQRRRKENAANRSRGLPAGTTVALRGPGRRIRFLLRQLELPDDAIPRLPETLTAAASNGNLQAIAQFLEAGSDINEKSIGFASFSRPPQTQANSSQSICCSSAARTRIANP